MEKGSSWMHKNPSFFLMVSIFFANKNILQVNQDKSIERNKNIRKDSEITWL